MSLEKAHKGYEYQDLLTAYYILNEIIGDFESSFIIDKKEYRGDKFDDLTINREGRLFKKQIKYSDNHTLSKPDLSTDGIYSLALDSLYDAWMASPSKDDISEVRLCLGWNEPVGADILEVLTLSQVSKSINSHDTKLYNIDIEKLWDGTVPLPTWRRLRKWSATVNKSSFQEFCKLLIIEVNLPRFSLDFDRPDVLELLLLKQSDALGAGIYPNEGLKPIDLILRLLQLVRSSRISGLVLNTTEILNKLNIRRDFGSISQVFPVDIKQNLIQRYAVRALYTHLKKNPKTLLHGEPGSGKSWMVNNLTAFCKTKSIPVIRHYCYTDLEDDFQKERIKLNVFYGNLISEILRCFPGLSKKKKSKFGSSFDDLNALLKAIDTETVVIIDGLDHINRIFEFRNYIDVASQDIKIIESLAMLEPSKKVRLVITSQPVKELEPVSAFSEFQIPVWHLSQVKALMQKLSLQDGVISESGQRKSEFILERSGGNPLYTSFLIKEIRDHIIPDASLKNLPHYSFNLEPYYNYLLNKLNTKEQVPRILSGVNFALTKTELVEITGDGDTVADSLESLSSILKYNFSRDGYIIYHESFRRFILNTLKSKNIDIAKNVFSPIAEWFEQKGLFEYQKSFRYYLPFLSDGGDFNEILKYVKIDFVFNSLINGQPWNLIEKNYKYLAFAAARVGQYNNIIIVSELNKVVSTTQDTFDSLYSHYVEALGNLKGYNYVHDALSFEGNPTVDPRLGLEACYLCSINNFPPIWDLYIDSFFKQGKRIDKKDFHLYLRSCIDSNDVERISKIAKQIKKFEEYQRIFRKEMLKVNNEAFLDQLESKPEVQKLLLERPTKDASIDISKVCDELLKSTYAHENEEKLIKELLTFVRAEHHNKAMMDFLIENFSNRNWFYNWIIFIIKFTIIEDGKDINEEEILEAFKYLTKDTKPFKGEPRTCDLYQLRHKLYDSYRSVFSHITSKKIWRDVIEIVLKVSEDTTTSLNGSLSGPLPPDELFSLLKEFANSENSEIILEVLEQQEKSNSESHLYSYVAEYNFILSQLYSKSGKFEKAQANFEMGVRYAISYTFRKDITLTENMISLENINSLGDAFSLSAFKKSKLLVDTVVEHTDGRETKHYPIKWFDAFFDNHPVEGVLYLRYELNQTRLDWRLESSLLKALHTAADVSPLIRLFILRTFIVEWSEEHLNNCLDVYESVVVTNHNAIAKSFLSSIYTKCHADLRSTTGYSLTFINRISRLLNGFNDLILPSVSDKVYKKRESKTKPNLIENFKKEFKGRISFSDATLIEVKQYLKKDNVGKTDINSLCYYFDQFGHLTQDLKDVIQAMTNREGYNSQHIEDYEVLFEGNKEAYVYYWVCCFVFEKDTWYEDLGYTNFYKKAHDIDPELATAYLRELIHAKLSLGFNVGLSGNLINAFSKIEFEEDKLKEMWETLFDATSTRLPVLEVYSWDESISNDLEMGMDEIYVCLLFTRFRSFTVERASLTLGGVNYLLHVNPEKMIKPLKWFLRACNEYLDTIVVAVLTMLYDYEKINPGYKSNFVEEIDALYPKNYFLIDNAIELLYGKVKKKITFQHPNRAIYSEMPHHKSFEFFAAINSRHEVLCEQFPEEMLDVYMEHRIRFKDEYNNRLELYFSQSNGITVANLYFYDFILNEINTRLYEQLKSYKNQNDIFRDLTIPVKELAAQANSGTHRPKSLPLPSSVTGGIFSDIVNGEYIRIAHFEEELTQEDRGGKINFHKMYGGIYFDSSSEDLDNPATLRGLPDLESYKYLKGDDGIVVLFFIQRLRYLEDFNLIYPSPSLLNYLSLELKYETDGIYAVNNEGERIIRYQTWKSDYMGNGYVTGIADEIPKCEGAELLIRHDYYKKLLNYYGNGEAKYRLTVLS